MQTQKGSATIIVFIALLLTLGGAVWYFKNFPLEKLPMEKSTDQSQTVKESFDDSDLQSQITNVPKEQNMLFDLVKAASVAHSTTGGSDFDHVSGKTWNEEYVKRLLAENKEALRYFSEAANKPQFFDENFKDPQKMESGNPMFQLNSSRLLARISVINAMELYRNGKQEEAVAGLLETAYVGQKIEDFGGMLLLYLVGTANKIVALQKTQEMLSSGKPYSLSGLDRFSKKLETMDKANGLQETFKTEYAHQAFLMNTLASGDLAVNEDLGIDEESAKELKGQTAVLSKTKKLLADAARWEIKSVNNPCDKIDFSFIEKTKANAGKGIPESLAAIGVAGISSVFGKKCEQQFLVSGNRILIALKKYKMEHNSYPDSLNVLTPVYISTVPKDPYSGEEIQYSKEKQEIYLKGKTNDKKFVITFN